jgi:hypothetical protein
LTITKGETSFFSNEPNETRKIICLKGKIAYLSTMILHIHPDSDISATYKQGYEVVVFLGEQLRVDGEHPMHVAHHHVGEQLMERISKKRKERKERN